MTESQALEELSRMGFKVEVVAYRYTLEATAYVFKSKAGWKNRKKPEYVPEYFASVAASPFLEGKQDAGYATLMRRLLLAVEKRMKERNATGDKGPVL